VAAHTAVTLLDIHLPAACSVEVPLPRGHRAFAIVLQGGLLTLDGEVAAHHALRYFDNGAALRLQAGASNTWVVVLAGSPIGEPIVPRGPFIANSVAQAADMMRRFRQGEMGSLEPSVFL
jgi:quercetin 2,3-dioxygenase